MKGSLASDAAGDSDHGIRSESMTISNQQHAERLAELRRVFDNGAAIRCPTFQNAAKRVGIDNTYAAWAAWLGVSAAG